ncbi:MAG: diacylglycerol kinase family lipid kinase [Clostridiales bacterium]|nr:diacylglycerol kinase family lipid kinase [Clostridiales bacterium]
MLKIGIITLYLCKEKRMLYFIVNKLSGKGKGGEIQEKIITRLKEENIEFKMVETLKKEHAIELAQEISLKEDCTGLVAVGGDGTFSEVLNGIKKDVPIGFISSGSGNDFLRTFAPKKDFEAQLDAIIQGKTKKIDYIQINEKRSLNVAGTGFDIDILLLERKLRKFLSGSFCYYAALIITIFTLKFRKFSIKIDDEKEINEDCLIMSLANGKYFGGGMPISLDSRLDDGIMDLVLITKLPFYHIPGILIKFMKGKLQEETRYVKTYRVKKVECSVKPEVQMQTDGEIHFMPSFKAELIENGLTVFY